MTEQPPERTTLLTFPCDFPLKIMGKRTAEFAQTVAAVVLEHAPDFAVCTMEMRPSREGNYLALTCTVRAVSQAQLDGLYRGLSSHPAVSVVL
ncbi:MAG: YbeD family protein [Burkholderiaceae bacterium]|jgi:putative lipoic acid-binding regulatory protein